MSLYLKFRESSTNRRVPSRRSSHWLVYHTCHCVLYFTILTIRRDHSRVCDVCVASMDHHCSWLLNCIGERNYTSFFAFLAVLPTFYVSRASVHYSLLILNPKFFFIADLLHRSQLRILHLHLPTGRTGPHIKYKPNSRLSTTSRHVCLYCRTTYPNINAPVRKPTTSYRGS